MLLKRINIENFRGFKSIQLDLDQTTVLIGENNCGKTSLLEAVRLCLSRSFSRRAIPFEDQDYHLPSATARPGDAGPLQIGLQFAATHCPVKIWDLLSRAQVNVAAVTGASLPLLKHGAGTQSLASIFLFEAFLATGLGKVDPLASSLLQIEKPEAHLHPSAIRALWPTLASTPGQKIIATHSGDLLSEVPLEAIRRLRRTQTGVEVLSLQPNTLPPEEIRKVKFHVRRSRAQPFSASDRLVWDSVRPAADTPLHGGAFLF
jgi:predicted ATP-dependent endonuclease of OLD family